MLKKLVSMMLVIAILSTSSVYAFGSGENHIDKGIKTIREKGEAIAVSSYVDHTEDTEAQLL